ncbi:MAG: hypothetical protein V4667_13950 [Bacteroidota bacterium]
MIVIISPLLFEGILIDGRLNLINAEKTKNATKKNVEKNGE